MTPRFSEDMAAADQDGPVFRNPRGTRKSGRGRDGP